jgi:hypothetical protein
MGEFSGGEPTKRESAIAAIEAATKSFLESRWHGVADEVRSSPPSTGCEREYPVADLLGSCFLRVCFWADFFASWARRGRLLEIRDSPGRAAPDR